MAIDTLTASFAEPADLTGALKQRLARYLRVQVEDWCDVCRNVSAWEEHYLLDQPTPERLAEHLRQLELLEMVGQWLLRTAQHPQMPDRKITDLIAMTLQDLKDRRTLWHGKLNPNQREEILREVFNES